MITSVTSASPYPVRVLLGIEKATPVYHVPRYQREYAWGKEQCDALLNDILDSDPGYYLGSIVCVPISGNVMIPHLELVDGQQRMTTVSLLLAAIYKALASSGLPHSSMDMEQQLKFRLLEKNLTLGKGPEDTRVVPQKQGENLPDYLAVLSDVGCLHHIEPLPYAGNRKIFRAYRHFEAAIKKMVQDQSANDAVACIVDLLDKIHMATMVNIQVADHANAYILFEALNNRGTPLTAIEIIKNKLLARLEKVQPAELDRHFHEWSQILKCLGDGQKDGQKNMRNQERFLRQYYNAFRLGPEAKRSNLIGHYDKLIEKGPQDFLRNIGEAGRAYGLLLRTRSNDNRFPQKAREMMNDLDRIEGAPSYTLLLFLLMRHKELKLDGEKIADIIQFLSHFFVRRNLTDKPLTREMDRLFMGINDKIADKTGDEVVATIRAELREKSSSDADFRAALAGNIYEENYSATRFVLCALAEEGMTNESRVNLWQRPGKDYIWTVEHVFPQGENIPEYWVEMIAEGDREKAEEIRQNHVHKLGNLTLSGYNKSLGNKSFEDKRDRTNSAGNPIGYNNGLRINADLANRNDWSEDAILERTAKLVDQAMVVFRLD